MIETLTPVGAVQTSGASKHHRHLAGSIAAAALFALFSCGLTGPSAGQAPDTPPPETRAAPSSEGKSTLEAVTVEARRQLERQVSHYVATVVVHYLQDSLARWDGPICPLVAGLPRERGEFVLQRISQIAAEAGAPLAGERCQANLFVVVSPEPDLLLKRWLARSPNMYNRANGLGYINHFLHSSLPIRSCYNTGFRSSDGTVLSADSLEAGLIGLSLGTAAHYPTNRISGGTRLRYTAVQNLSSVIILVDLKRTQDLTIGQLADYVAMVGLAQIRDDADFAGIPTILRLFQDPREPPQGLSPWDQAFLYSLYQTNQVSVMQPSAIRMTMLKRIGSR